MVRYTSPIFLVLVGLLLATHSTSAQTVSKAEAMRKRYAPQVGLTVGGSTIVNVPMRDGVKLSTSITFPLSQETKFSAVIDRSPYGHQATELIADVFLLIGYVAVGQDMRGTKESEGNFTMWKSDSHDGHDLIEWIVQQSWSNGKVYQVGASADGVAAFTLSKDMHPALKGQAILVATADAYTTIYPGGAFKKNLLEMWLSHTGMLVLFLFSLCHLPPYFVFGFIPQSA